LFGDLSLELVQILLIAVLDLGDVRLLALEILHHLDMLFSQRGELDRCGRPDFF
jgi:hypothetical protein